MVDEKRGFFVYSKVQIAYSCQELMFDVPALALVDNAEFRAGVSTCVVRAWDGEVGYEEGVV